MFPFPFWQPPHHTPPTRNPNPLGGRSQKESCSSNCKSTAKRKKEVRKKKLCPLRTTRSISGLDCNATSSRVSEALGVLFLQNFNFFKSENPFRSQIRFPKEHMGMGGASACTGNRLKRRRACLQHQHDKVHGRLHWRPSGGAEAEAPCHVSRSPAFNDRKREKHFNPIPLFLKSQ